MRTENLLAKLVPKTLVPTGEGAGGNEKLTALDVAAALAMAKLPKHAYWYALAKYCLDEDAERRAHMALNNLIRDYCDKQRWPYKESYTQGIAFALIRERVRPPLCRRCRGRGYYMHRTKVVACDSCDKAGTKPMSARQVARLCNMPKTTFQRTWQPRMKLFDSWIGEWEDVIVARLKRQLQERRAA